MPVELTVDCSWDEKEKQAIIERIVDYRPQQLCTEEVYTMLNPIDLYDLDYEVREELSGE